MIANSDPNSGHTQAFSTDRGPTVLRIALGGQLRRLREECGVSREEAGEAIRGSHAKISRLELGRTGFKERDLRDLLALYGVSDPAEVAEFVALARQANQPGWWQRYGDLLPSWFETYIGLEQAASVIRSYETQFVPGLLQTPEYARAVVMLAHRGEDVERRVSMRMRRQRVLQRREDAPAVWAVIDEAALRRPVGGVEVMRAQIDALIAAVRSPNVTIQVMPYAAGGHAAAGGSFSILRFPEPELPDIVYIEQLTSALYLDKRADLQLYLTVMDKLSVQAEQPDRTVELLEKLRP
jgi:transcriptional regulator with XRE-family HTH domain